MLSPSWKLSKGISGFTSGTQGGKKVLGGGHLEEEGTSGREKECPGERRGEKWTEVCTVGESPWGREKKEVNVEDTGTLGR